MLVGYMRISTSETRQSTDLQRDALVGAGVDPRNLHSDVASGAKVERPGLKTCLGYLTAGDVLVVWKLDRLGRSLPHLVTLLEELRGRGVLFKSLTEGMDTTTPSGELLFNIVASPSRSSSAVADPRAGERRPRRGSQAGQGGRSAPGDLRRAHGADRGCAGPGSLEGGGSAGVRGQPRHAASGDVAKSRDRQRDAVDQSNRHDIDGEGPIAARIRQDTAICAIIDL